MTDTFDLRDVLSGRKYPTARVAVVLNDEVLWEIVELQRELERSITDQSIDAKAIEKKLEVKYEERDKGAYWVHLRATSPRCREEIQSEALAQFPYKPDPYGRDDTSQSIHRSRLVTELIFAAHITKIVSPTGSEQVWTEENKRDLARSFLGEAPDHAIKIVDAAITELRGEEAAVFSRVSDLDFLSDT